MSTKVRQSGLTGSNPVWGAGAAFTMSDGSAVVVCYDTNVATEPSGWGDLSGTAKVYVYSSVDRIAWTLRATITPPISAGVRITATVSADNTIGIVAHAPLNIRYVTVSSAWVVGSWETVHTAITSPNANDETSISFSDGNVPFITTLRSTNTGSTRLMVLGFCRTGVATWVQVTLATLETTVTPKRVFEALWVTVLKGGAAATRNVVFAAGHGNNVTDTGVELWTVKLNETTGAITSPTKRATYVAGEVPGTSTAVMSRQVMIFPSDINEYVLSIQHWQKNRTYGITRGTYDGTTWAVTQAWTSRTVPSDWILNQYGMAMTYSSGSVQFIYAGIKGYLLSFLVRLTETGVSFSDDRWWDNKKTPSVTPLGGVSPNVQFGKHDMLFMYQILTNKQEFEHHYAALLPAPINVIPAAGSTVITSTPVLRAYSDLNIAQPQSLINMRWEFATDSAFTTNLRVYGQDDTKFKLVRNTDLVGASILFEDRLPVDGALTQGVWYVRCAQMDEMDNIGTYSATASFTVSHPPAAGSLAPSGGKVIIYGAGSIPFSWKFTDPYSSDHQTAFDIIVERSSTGVVILDTGKITSLTQSTSQAIAAGEKDKDLRWKVALWDMDDIQGSYSPYASFQIVDAPTVSITTPANGSTVTTAGTSIVLTSAVGGERIITSYKITITSGGIVLDNKVTSVSLPLGGTITYSLDPDLLINATTYTVTAKVTDNYGVESTTATSTFTTAWTPPAAGSSLVVNMTPFNTEGQGWVDVTWTDTARDVDFTCWNLYRQSDLIDPNTGVVLEAGTRTKLATVTVTAASYSYKDYYAPSGYRSYYWVEQQVNRFGDVVESNGSSYNVIPISDSYWVIQPDTNDAFQLGSVTSDSYDEVYEEEEMHLIGRGRRIEQGDRLGYSGSLTTQIRDRGGISARQRKKRLEDLKKEQRTLYLRTPFGDVFRVAVMTMSVGRIAGVGTSEFVDVTIPYMEITP